jgi:LysM repeat protein
MLGLGDQPSRQGAAAILAVACVLLCGALPAKAEPDPPTLVAVTPTVPTETQPGGAAAPPRTQGAPAPTDSTKPAGDDQAKKASKPRKRRPRKRRRGGVHPCMTKDPGFGIYDRWSRNITMGQMIAPQRGGLTKAGGFDLVIHFHGHYPIRKEFVKEAKGPVLVAIDLGVGSGAYSRAFASPSTFPTLLKSVEREMARRSGRKKTYVRKLALSSWSAGYGAVGQILRQPGGKKVDALMLFDSVYGGYVSGSTTKLKTAELKPFIKFARKAARGSKLMFQSHSSIIPPGYASTGEVSAHMVKQLGGKLRRARRKDVLGLELIERYDRGGYHVRGYGGNDKPDHCAHLGLMKDVLKVHLNPRWRSPRGRKGKRAIAQAKVKARKNGTIHTVASGEHLSGIAKRYGTTVRAIRNENGLEREGRPIQPGQDLVIPRSAKKAAGSSPKARGTATAQPAAGEVTHKVASGHTLGKIARRYHTTVDALRQRNGLVKGGKRIRPGQTLIIPAPAKTR